MKSMPRNTLAAALAALLLAAGPTSHAATNTFIGKSVNWSGATNWLSGSVPATGDDIVIADATTNASITLNDGPHTVGILQLGTTGTRITAFAVNANANTLTLTNGVIANGNFTVAGSAPFEIKVPVTIQGDQNWSVGGDPGSATSDRGIRTRERATGTQNLVTLNGKLTKTGTGQLSLVGNNIGNGDIAVNQGSLKLNAGGTTALTIGGTGAITVNSGASLYFSKNSGSFFVTKAVVMNSGSTVRFGSSGGATDTMGSPYTFNGAVTLSLDLNANNTLTFTFTNNWSGPGTVTLNSLSTAIGNYNLSGDNSGLTGRLNLTGNAIHVRFVSPNSSSAAAEWSLNQANASLEAFGATSLRLGALSGASGTLRNNDPSSQPVTATVGALNTSTTFGGVIADGTAALSLVKVGTGNLTLTGNNTYSGSTVVSNGTLTINNVTSSTGSGSVTMKPGTTLTGTGTASGAVTLERGTTVEVIGGAGATPLTVGSLALGQTATDLTATRLNVYLGGKIAATSGLAVTGTNVVTVLGAAPAVGVYDLITYGGGPIGGAGFSGFVLGALPYGVVAHLQDSGAAVQLNVTAVTIEPGIWVGNASSLWDLSGTLDWKGATSGNPQPYHDLDFVSFDDSATSFAVNVATNVTPGSVTVNNATHTYTFAGSGGIVGATALLKEGPGALVLLTSNNYTAGTIISNGVLQLGNGSTNGSIAGSIVNESSLVLDRADALILGGNISGLGTVEQRGAGVATLGGANSYAGLTTITTGTLATGSGSALGDTNAGTTVVLGATLDVNGQNLGMEPITVLGAGVGNAGAIVNNGTGDQQNALRYVTLTGPTTFGGARRWDIRDTAHANDPSGGINAYLHGSGFPLTKVGSNIVAFISIGDTGLGNIDIQGGTLTFSRSTMAGNPASKLNVWPGATLQFHILNQYQSNPFDKVISLTNAALAVESAGQTNDVIGPITLTGSNVVVLPSGTGLKLHGTMDGSGSLNSAGPGYLVLAGNCTYAGGTTYGGGVLQVDGTLSASASITALTSATLTGTGVISGPVTLPSGCTLAPGSGDIGTLSFGSLAIQAGSTTRCKVNTDAVSNDRINAASSLTYGGTLVITNYGSTAYAPGNSFKLFNATSYSGGFASIVPATPALGLMWDTNSLTVDGTIKVIVVPTPRPLVVLSAGSLVPMQVNVIFDTEVDPSTAMDPNNYILSTGQTVSFVTLLSVTNALLQLDTPITTTNFTVQVKNVKDLAYVPNVVATTNVPALAWNFLGTEKVIIADNLAFAYGSQIKVYGSGADIFGTADQFEFVYQSVTNDFDIAVRLESHLPTDGSAKAGLMAREFDPNQPGVILADQRNAFVFAFPPAPGRELNVFSCRETAGGNTTSPGARPPTTYTNNWLRLQRTGDVFYAYTGTNNLDWTFVGSLDTSTNAAGAFATNLYLGLAVTSHNTALVNEAIFSAYGPAKERPALTVAQSGGQVTLSWPLSGLGWTLQATPNLNTPTIWTNVPGSAATNLIHVPAGSENSFFRLVE